jgi:hypothetical protein
MNRPPRAARMAHRAILPAALLGLLLLVPAATAHATCFTSGTGACTSTAQAGSKVKFVYGNLYEPVSTYQKTGLDLTVADAKGNPIAGLEAVDHEGKALANPPIHVSLVYSGQVLDMTPEFKGQFNAPGKYTFPLIYTKAGAYVLHVTGTINGTAVDQMVQPAHPVEDSSELMFPTKVDSPEESATKVTELTGKVTQLNDDVAALKARINSLEGSSSKGAPGVDGGLLVLGAIAVLGLAAATRRA